MMPIGGKPMTCSRPFLPRVVAGDRVELRIADVDEDDPPGPGARGRCASSGTAVWGLAFCSTPEDSTGPG